MIIYCDCLNFGSCIQIIRLYWQSLFSSKKKINIKVLDPIPDRGWSALLLFIVRFLGFRIEEAKFFAGHLRTSDGQAVGIAYQSVSIDLALRAAKSILASSRLLAQLNHEWGRNTILKHIARYLEIQAQPIVKRFMVVETLKRTKGESDVVFVIQRHFSFDKELLRSLSNDMELFFYRTWGYNFLKRSRLSVLFFILLEKLRKTKWKFEVLIGKGSCIEKCFYAEKQDLPSLLALQEDDLSMDRSYRTQPHWLFAEHDNKSFKTLVLQVNSSERLPVDNRILKKHGIIPISQKQQYLLTRKFRSSNPIQKRLNVHILKCVLRSIFGFAVEVEAVFFTARLLYIAKGLVAFCEQNRVKAFMTCENYMLQADAMSIIASTLNITTLSYQYSNISMVGPTMVTTADKMLTFAPIYHKRWMCDTIRPKEFIDIGYIYDTSFKYLRERARVHRSQLEKAGAQFVICYFDESVQGGKYGLVSVEDHCAEIKALLKLVNSDPTIGLVIKAQFQWNTPQQFDEIANFRADAQATGRYLELIYGNHRNIVFPAEAALVSDITIGHYVGATASLEAALVGVRSILINSYKMQGRNDTLYTQADIVYSSMDSALKAIHSFRSGSHDHKGLGDWSTIIDQFDPFRDGNAGHRMRDLLEQIVLRDYK